MIAGMLSQRSHFWILVSIRVALLFNYPYFLYDIFFQPLLKPHSSSTKLITLYCQEKMLIMNIFFFISSDIKKGHWPVDGKIHQEQVKKGHSSGEWSSHSSCLPSFGTSAYWVVPMRKTYIHISGDFIWDATYAAVSQPHLSDLSIYSQYCIVHVATCGLLAVHPE